MATSTNKTKIILGTLLIFALGVWAGVLGERMYHRHRIEQMFAKGERPPLERLFMKRLSKDLDLTEAQKARIEEIVNRSFNELNELKSTISPQSEKIIDKTFAKIKKELNEEQKQELKEMRRRFRCFAGIRSRPGAKESAFFETFSKHFLEAVDQRIPLPEEKRTQVHTIVAEHLARQRDILREAHVEGLPLPPGIREALKEQNRETEKKLSDFLTEEQVDEYVKIRREQRDEMWRGLRALKEGKATQTQR